MLFAFMPWQVALVIGLIIVAFVLFFVIRTKITVTEPIASTYTGYISSGQDELISKLVNEIGPAVEGKVFGKRDIDKMIGNNASFDGEVYFHFRELLESGNLTTNNLRKALAKGTV